MKSVLQAGVVLAVIGAGSPVAAHPHVFVDAKAEFKFDEAGQLAALRITWMYDAFTTLALMEALGLDQDNDGVLSADDLARVVDAQTIWPDYFLGDTYLDAAGENVALGRPTDGAAAMEELRISVSFDLPLFAPVEPGSGVELRLYDPTYYYAYATLDVVAPEQCAATVTQFQADQATSALQAQLARLSREETPDQAGVGRLFADLVRLECA